MRAIEKFAARRRVRRSYHAKAAWTRTRSWCNEEAIDDRQRRRDRSAASGITFATIGAEISGLWRVSILCSTRNTGAPSVPNVVDDPYRTVIQDFVEALEQVAKDTSCREKFYFSMSLCVDYCSNLLSRGVVSETCKRYLKIIDNIPFCCFFCSSLVMVSFTKIESSKACARIIDIVC